MGQKTKGEIEMYEKIKGYLNKKRVKYELDSIGRFLIRENSTSVRIDTLESNKRILVYVTGQIAIDITNINFELTRFIAEENSDIFGKIILDDESHSILYRHFLFGEFMDADEIFYSIYIGINTINSYTKILPNMAGGKIPVN